MLQRKILKTDVLERRLGASGSEFLWHAGVTNTNGHLTCCRMQCHIKISENKEIGHAKNDKGGTAKRGKSEIRNSMHKIYRT